MKFDQDRFTALPMEAQEYIAGIVARTRCRRDERRELMMELTAHFEDALAPFGEGERRSEEARRLIKEFGEPRLLSTLIRRGKIRCRPWWQTALVGIVQAGLAGLILLLALGWFSGRRAEFSYQESLARLVQEGGLPNFEALRSTRPPDTHFVDDTEAVTVLDYLLQPKKFGLEFKEMPNDLIPEDFLTRFEKEPADMEALHARIETQRPALDQLSRIAALPPVPMDQIISKCSLSGDRTKASGPEPFVVLDGSDWLLLDAYVQYRSGQADEALRKCIIVFSLAQQIDDVPILVSLMVGHALRSNASALLQKVLWAPSLSETALEELDRCLSAQNSRPAMAQALEAELLGMRTAIHDARESGSTALAALFAKSSSESRQLPWFTRWYFSPMLRAFSAPDEISLYESIHQLAMDMRKPYYEVHPSPQNMGEDPQTDFKKDYRWKPLTQYVLPVISAGLLREQAANDAKMDQARTAVALLRYFQRHGLYPDTLAALTPDLLPNVPRDAFSGKAMGYIRDQDRFILYSVGINGLDETNGAAFFNAGQIATAKSDSKPFGDDIVWGAATIH